MRALQINNSVSRIRDIICPKKTSRAHISKAHHVPAEVYEARRRVAEKALKHAINCDIICRYLDEYASSAQLVTYRSECAMNAKVAWDIVEEVYAALGDVRFLKHQYCSLDDYCEQFPHTDECRVYEI